MYAQWGARMGRISLWHAARSQSSYSAVGGDSGSICTMQHQRACRSAKQHQASPIPVLGRTMHLSSQTRIYLSARGQTKLRGFLSPDWLVRVFSPQAARLQSQTQMLLSKHGANIRPEPFLVAGMYIKPGTDFGPMAGTVIVHAGLHIERARHFGQSA